MVDVGPGQLSSRSPEEMVATSLITLTQILWLTSLLHFSGMSLEVG